SADRIAERAARGIYLACEQALDRVVTGIDYLDRIEHAVAFEQQFRENSYHSRTRPNFLAFELADVRELLATFLEPGEHHSRTFVPHDADDERREAAASNVHSLVTAGDCEILIAECGLLCREIRPLARLDLRDRQSFVIVEPLSLRRIVGDV